MVLLLYNNHTSKPDLAAQHMLESIIRFIKRELLNHALDFVELSEFNSLFAIERLARGPAVHGNTFSDHGDGVDFDFARS